MNRHGAFTALAVGGTLVLAACGAGSPASHGGVRVAGVVHIGPYTQEFASPLPANTARASVVEGFREGQVLWDRSQDARHLVPRVRDYVTGQALTHLTSAVKADKSHDLVPAGADRFFRTRVTAIGGHNATVTTCDDGSRFKEENPGTGKVDTSFLPTPGQQYLFETWRMVRLGGHWAIRTFSVASLPSSGAEPCQPGMAALAGSVPSRPPAIAVLLREMGAALRAASSVHISGIIQRGGKALGVNFGITRSGRVSGQISEDGAALTLLATHGHAYLKLTAAFLRIAHLPATVCSVFCGKYVEYPVAQSHQMLARLSLASMTNSLAGTPASKVRYLGVVAVDGRAAWLLQDSQRNSIYVAARGRPYLLREVAGPPSKDSLNLTEWNTVRVPGPPPATKIVQLGQLSR